MNFKTSNLPPILELAERIRNGETAQAICDQYGVAVNTLRARFTQAGFSLATGRAIGSIDREPLPGGHTGGGGQYVGGGDWNRGLPTEPRPHRPRKPRPTGLDWEAISSGPRDDSVWASTKKVKMNRHGDRFTEAQDNPEQPQIPAVPAPEPTVVPAQTISIPEGLDQVDREAALDGERYDGPVIEEPAQPAVEPPAEQSAPGRPGRPAGRIFTFDEEADIVHRYKLGESTNSIALVHHTHAPTVRRILIAAGIKIRSRAEAAAHRHNPDNVEGLKQREGDQPLPVINDHTDIQSMVIADIEARRQVGISRYGTALQPFNGRDALQDLYEELIDAAMYIKQCMVERDATPTGAELARPARISAVPAEQNPPAV